MKTLHNFMKKSLSTTLVVICAVVLIMISNKSNATNYQTIMYDNYAIGTNVPYCPCDSIKCVPPAGATGVLWAPALTTHGDTLVLASGFDGQVTCYYTGGLKDLSLRPTSLLTTPPFSNKTICGIEKDSLDAGNYSSYGFTSYLWSTGATTQKIIVGAGTYTVTVTGACNTITHSAVITESNPTPPNLGPDQILCQGGSVTLNPGSGYTNYHWSTSVTTPTITVTTSGIYWVTTTNTGTGCQDLDTIHITFVQPPTKPICYAGYDTITAKNNVYVPTNLAANIDSLHIYVEVTSTVWNKIGAIKAGTPYFTDMASNPQSQSYSYKIAVVDTCGNEGAKSLAHTTITLLSTYDSGTDTYGFTWSAYVGLVPGNYNIYGIDSSGAATIVGTVPGTQYFYNYVHPSHSYLKYFVGFPGPDCSSMKTASVVKSNVLHSLLTGIHEEGITSIRFSFYPNPVSDMLTIQTGNTIREIQLMDVVGSMILTTTQKTIDCSHLTSGVYFIKVITQKGFGIQKFVKE